MLHLSSFFHFDDISFGARKEHPPYISEQNLVTLMKQHTALFNIINN